MSRPTYYLKSGGNKNPGGSAMFQRNEERIQRKRDEQKMARYQRAFDKWCEWMRQECEE